MNGFKLLMGIATIAIGYGGYGIYMSYTGSPSIDMANNNDIATIAYMEELNSIAPSMGHDHSDNDCENVINNKTECIEDMMQE